MPKAFLDPPPPPSEIKLHGMLQRRGGVRGCSHMFGVGATSRRFFGNLFLATEGTPTRKEKCRKGGAPPPLFRHYYKGGGCEAQPAPCARHRPLRLPHWCMHCTFCNSLLPKKDEPCRCLKPSGCYNPRCRGQPPRRQHVSASVMGLANCHVTRRIHPSNCSGGTATCFHGGNGRISTPTRSRRAASREGRPADPCPSPDIQWSACQHGPGAG